MAAQGARVKSDDEVYQEFTSLSGFAAWERLAARDRRFTKTDEGWVYEEKKAPAAAEARTGSAGPSSAWGPFPSPSDRGKWFEDNGYPDVAWALRTDFGRLEAA